MRKSYSATIWTIFDKVWAQIVGFVIGIVLARLLMPEDYGLVGISMIFIAFANVFIEAGFSNALIRKLDVSEADYSTAFYFNAVMSIIMYFVLFCAAPYIAFYFSEKELVLLTRVVGVTIVLNSLCIVQNAILTKELRMKEQAVIGIMSQIPAGLVAIYLAYIGFGVYALAIQAVLGSLIRVVMFSVIAKWYPILVFSKESMNYLWSFSSKLIGANFLGTVFNEIYSVLIGKFLGIADLGIYSKGRSLSTQPDTICNGVVQKVALPLLAKYQDSPEALKSKYRQLTMLITCIMTLISGILICVAHPMILFLWGDKWAETIGVFQLLIITSLVSYISYLSLLLLQIVNHTEYTLKLEFLKKPVYLVFIFLLLKYGLYGLLLAQIISSLIATVVNISAPSKFIGYSYKEQIKDISKYLIAWILGSLIVYGVFCIIQLPYILDIMAKAIVMTISYIAVLWVLKDEILIYFFDMLKMFVRRNFLK